jgi:arylsulfatase A-like enzyme
MSYYTGRYVSSHGATHNRVPLSVGEVTLGWHLREAGRTLALAGKTHVLPDAHGMKRLQLDGQHDLAALLKEGWFTLVDRHDGHHAEPDSAYAHWLRARGYDSKDPWTDYVIAVQDEQGQVHNGWKMRNARLPARVAEEHSETAYTADQGIAFMEQQGEAPWVLHLSFVKPHWPYIAPAPYHAMYSPNQCLPVSRHPGELGPEAHPLLREWQNEEVSQSFQADDCITTVRPAYQGLITQLDDHLGRVWEALDRLGRWKDTLVVFCSDHGDYLGDHWLGEKELFHDCVQRVPMLVYDPSAAADATRGTVEDRFVEAIDLVPTFLDALDLDPAPHLLEGRSLLGLTRGTAEGWGAAAAGREGGAAPRLDDPRRALEIHPLDQRLPPAIVRSAGGPGGIFRPRCRSGTGRRAPGDARKAADLVHRPQAPHHADLGRGRVADGPAQGCRRLLRGVVGHQVMASACCASRPLRVWCPEAATQIRAREDTK